MQSVDMDCVHIKGTSKKKLHSKGKEPNFYQRAAMLVKVSLLL